MHNAKLKQVAVAAIVAGLTGTAIADSGQDPSEAQDAQSAADQAQATNAQPQAAAEQDPLAEFAAAEAGAATDQTQAAEPGSSESDPADSFADATADDPAESDSPATADQQLLVRGTDSSISLVAELAAAFEEQTGQPIAVEGGGASDGPQNELEQGINFTFISRPLSAEEQGSGLVGFEYGRDGVAVIVNETNPVTTLTLTQVSEFFQGDTPAWGDGQPVSTFGETPASGAWQGFETAFLNQEAIGAAVENQPASAVIESVSSNEAAIGFTAASELAGANGVRAIDLEGVALSAETVGNGTYPASFPLTLVTQGEPTGTAQAFVQFVLGPAGQQIVADAGFGTVSQAEEVQTASVETEPQE